MAFNDSAKEFYEEGAGALRTPEGISFPLMSVEAIDINQAATIAGRRFTAEYDLDYTAGETKYYLFRAPEAADGYYVVLRERHWQTETGDADLEILWNTSGWTFGDTIPIFSENNLKVETPFCQVDELTAVADEGTIRERDFIRGTGQGGNSSGGISAETGFRIYGPDTHFIAKVTSADAQRVHLSYTWVEFSSELVDY